MTGCYNKLVDIASRDLLPTPLHLVSELWFVCQWLLLLLALGALGMDDGVEPGPTLQESVPAPPNNSPGAQAELEKMEEDGPSSLTVRASTDRELSLLLQNLHRAIDATSKGAAYSVSSAVHPSGGSVSGVTLPVKFDKWLSRARLDKPTKFDGESGEGVRLCLCDYVGVTLSL